MQQPQIPLSDRLAVCQQIARLARARLPISGELTKSLPAASRLAKVATSVEHDLSAGKSLRETLAKDNSRDSRILAACIEAGECSGRMDRALECWTGMHLANSRSVKSLRAAMLYPLMLITVTLCSLGYVMWTLIPEYKKTYELFGRTLPMWLDIVVLIRGQFWWLMVVTSVLAIAPLVIWAIRKRQFNAIGLPLDRAPRLRLQGLASELASLMIGKSEALARLVPISVAATGADGSYATTAFEKLQSRSLIEPLGRETTLILTSLHAGIMECAEASKHLNELANHFRHQADQMAQRQVQFLPMLIALVVGMLTILTYVLLVYLPWLLLLKQIVLPPGLVR